MNENIKNIISSKIKYHSNKQKYGYFIGNDCIDICASDILDDVIKAGYRKQEDTVKEFAERISKVIFDYLEVNSLEEADKLSLFASTLTYDVVTDELKILAEQYGKENEKI